MAGIWSLVVIGQPTDKSYIYLYIQINLSKSNIIVGMPISSEIITCTIEHAVKFAEISDIGTVF